MAQNGGEMVVMENINGIADGRGRTETNPWARNVRVGVFKDWDGLSVWFWSSSATNLSQVQLRGG